MEKSTSLKVEPLAPGFMCHRYTVFSSPLEDMCSLIKKDKCSLKKMWKIHENTEKKIKAIHNITPKKESC